MNITKLQQAFDNAVSIREYENSVLINDNMVYQDGSKESFAIGLIEQDGDIILNDLGVTYERLLKKDFDLNVDQDLQQYKLRVLKRFKLFFNENDELCTLASSEKDLPIALGRLEQGMILLSYIDLMFE